MILPLLALVVAAHAADTPLADLLRPKLPDNDRRTFTCENPSHSAHFWQYNDWGAVHRHKGTLKEYCMSAAQDRSSLVCNKELTFCNGRNIWAKVRRCF